MLSNLSGDGNVSAAVWNPEWPGVLQWRLRIHYPQIRREVKPCTDKQQQVNRAPQLQAKQGSCHYTQLYSRASRHGHGAG
eukprot:1144853-Pelagomonas_calceolata.AAC.10